MHKIVSLIISIVYIGTIICTRNTVQTNKKHKYLVISLSFLVIILNMFLVKPILEEITQESAESYASADSQKITQENAESQDLARKSYNSSILGKYKGYYTVIRDSVYGSLASHLSCQEGDAVSQGDLSCKETELFCMKIKNLYKNDVQTIP